MKYIVTYGKKRDRRIVLSKGKFKAFKTKTQAQKYLKSFKGYNPRIVKLDWM